MGDSIVLDGSVLTVRTAALDDVDRLARMFTRLSPRSVLFRFLAPIPRLPRGELVRLADVDHNRREALVAVAGDEIVGVARYGAPPGSRVAEVALVVEDAWQKRGVGQQLAWRLATLALARGYDTFVATMLRENDVARGLVRKLWPHAAIRHSGDELEARIALTALPAPDRMAMWSYSTVS